MRSPARVVVVLALLLLASSTEARAQGAPAEAPASAGAAAPLTRAVASGRHWRLETPHGAVHVWIPDGYRAETAAIVVYVHGYWIGVDGAWTDHRLPEQFALSGINAMFVACEAPAGPQELVQWRSLRALLATVRTGTGVALPRGRLVAVGHSGAFRTLIPWLANAQLDTVVLLDAVYEPEPFGAWVRASRRHRLIDIGEDTVRMTDLLHRSLPSTVTIDALPPPEAGALPPEAVAARIVYIRSQVGHMPLVTGGVALPMVLRALSVDTVATAPWSEPLGVLPPPPPPPLDDDAGSDDDTSSPSTIAVTDW